MAPEQLFSDSFKKTTRRCQNYCNVTRDPLYALRPLRRDSCSGIVAEPLQWLNISANAKLCILRMSHRQEEHHTVISLYTFANRFGQNKARGRETDTQECYRTLKTKMIECVCVCMCLSAAQTIVPKTSLQEHPKTFKRESARGELWRFCGGSGRRNGQDPQEDSMSFRL